MKGVFSGGKVYNTEFRRFENKNLFFEDGIITQISNKNTEKFDGEIIDVAGLLVAPGYVDIHTHGARKISFDDMFLLEKSYINTLAEHYLKHGVTSVFPTTSTIPVKMIVKNIEAATEHSMDRKIRIPGFHVEGPYLSYTKKGAHNPELLKVPEISELDDMLRAADGKLALRITVAPEIDGCTEFIKYATKKGVKCVIGHTDANFKTVTEAIELGADCMCHLYNAMSPLSHREPGAVGAALVSDKCFTEVICDGFHINPNVVNLTYKIKSGQDKFAIITDSINCAGVSEDFTFQSAGVTVYYHNEKALLEDGTIAGSTLNMHDATKNLSKFAHIPMNEAIYCATATPAKAAHVFDKVGSLEVSKFADITIMDDSYNIKNVYVGGIMRV